MSLPTRLTQFPHEFQQLIDAVAIEGRVITMPAERSVAVRMRQSFYQFRKLLLALDQPRGQLADTIMAVIEDGTITFKSRDNEPFVASLRKALNGPENGS